jgi:hypothetical protein
MIIVCTVKGIPFCAGLLLGGGLVLAAMPPALPNGLDDLVKDSPFLPRIGTPLDGVMSQLEFRGVQIIGNATMVGLYDRATGNSYWLPAPKAGQAGPPAATGEIAVREFDPVNTRLRVDNAGRELSLILAPTKVGVALPTDDLTPVPEIAPNVGNSAPQIAGEVPRRLSLRQVEVVNQALRESGAPALLPGNPGSAQ